MPVVGVATRSVGGGDERILGLVGTLLVEQSSKESKKNYRSTRKGGDDFE